MTTFGVVLREAAPAPNSGLQTGDDPERGGCYEARPEPVRYASWNLLTYVLASLCVSSISNFNFASN